MGMVLRVALRNLWRRPGRTALTVLMLTVCTILVVFTTGLADGSYAHMIRLATDTWIGQAEIMARGFEESPSLFETIDDAPALHSQLDAQPEVVASTSRVETAGLLSADVRTVGVGLFGVDPEGEARVSTLPTAVTRGTWLRAPSTPRAPALLPEEDAEGGGTAPPPIVVGLGVAQRLHVDLGHEVTFLGQAADGSIAAEIYTVVGILETGAAELDSSAAWIPLGDAQTLLELERRVHRVVVRLADPEDADALAHRVHLKPEEEYWTWQRLMPGLVDTIETDQTGDTIFRVVLIFVALLGLINTLMMSIFERTRELGVMMALGTSSGKVLGIATAEGAWLSLFGAVAGTAIGAMLNHHFATTGIVITSEPIEFGGIAFDRMYSANTWGSTAVYPMILFAGGALAGLWPAWRAARLDPVQAIRSL